MPAARRSALRLPAAGFCAACALVATGLESAQAQEKGYGQTLSTPQQQRELDYGSGPARSGSVLDSANPIELMNKLRRATAMDDATQPSDAVDAALKDFHSQSAPTPAPASPAATVKGP